MNEFKKKVKELNEDAEFKQFLTQEEDEKKRISTFEAIAREEGKVIGIKYNKIEIAKKLLNKEMPLKDIAEITGLEIKEIEEIKDFMKNDTKD